MNTSNTFHTTIVPRVSVHFVFQWSNYYANVMSILDYKYEIPVMAWDSVSHVIKTDTFDCFEVLRPSQHH